MENRVSSHISFLSALEVRTGSRGSLGVTGKHSIYDPGEREKGEIPGQS